MFKTVGDILLTDFSTQSLTELVSTDIHSESPVLLFAVSFTWLLEVDILEGEEGQRKVPLFSHPCQSTICELKYMILL